MARVTSVSSQRVALLDRGWRLSRHEPDEALDPAALAAMPHDALPASVPGTVASALLKRGKPLEGDLDASDFWYVTRFVAPSARAVLRFNGLATLAEVWLNRQLLLSTDSMFVAYERELLKLEIENELAIRFRSLKRALQRQSVRPRFKTRLVRDQGLRQVRTTLFGRMPGFTPPVAPVGPWRSVELVERGPLELESSDVRAGLAGADGRVSARLTLLHASGERIRSARLRVGDASAPLELVEQSETTGLFGALRRTRLGGRVELPRVARWWPHTHGSQPLFPVSVELTLGREQLEVELGRTGFRELELVSKDGGFELRVNGETTFCTGACIMPLDGYALDAPLPELERTLLAARAAGMNMLRVTANGIYESDAFFELCDALGIMVWQDFMFARMDYPLEQPFESSVELEARQLLDRTQLSPALVVLCGNSEVEQQVSMLGLDPELGRSRLFTRLLPELCAELRPDCVYVPSTPSGGALPFHVERGVSHYYGVGAYRRPLSDARLSNLRFAAECLAFSNVPDSDAVELFLDGEAPGSPAWKAGVPRDAGASWDYEDVRDHYLEQLFGLDARELRTSDPERWLELGRIATGEVMARTLGEWRRKGASCRGALIWHLRDYLPGAGCGLIDQAGRPKAAYFFVARALKPVLLIFCDEGLNGLQLHVLNEAGQPLEAELGLRLYRSGSVRVASAETTLSLEARSKQRFYVDSLIGGFVDSSYAYRFGPPPYDVAVASLTELVSRRQLAQSCFFPLGPAHERRADLALRGRALPHPEGYMLELEASAFAYAVHVAAAGFTPRDDYFELEPSRPKSVLLRADSPGGGALCARISALNGASALVVRRSEKEHAPAQPRAATLAAASQPKVSRSA